MNYSYCSPMQENNLTFHFLEDPIVPNEINESFVNEYYKLIAVEITFETWGYIAYGTANQNNKRLVSDVGNVRYFTKKKP